MRSSRPFPLVLAALLSTGPLAAQERGAATATMGTHGASGHALPSPTVHAAERTAPITLDGRLDEPIWATVEPATDFRQQDPHEGAPASQRTEIRLLFDDQALYIGARMFGGPVQFVLAGSGHIAGVINPPDKVKYQYWTHDSLKPKKLEDWIAKGVPVGLSLCYNRLRGKSAEPSGHLVVCVGFTAEGDPIINDPGTREDIRKVFPRRNLINAWAYSRNAAYLIYPENTEIPMDRFGHWQSWTSRSRIILE